MHLTADEKLAHQRLSVLRLAVALGNVSAACKQRGISRTQFYAYKRRFQTHGMVSRYERLLKLEEKAAQRAILSTAELATLIERANPAFLFLPAILGYNDAAGV
jgi:ACT domain-containing protein